MKHYYESEILNQLMERDGLKNPSSTPVYESEIREQLLNQVTPSYPKLNDYESEWLMYNHTKHLPADFPVESATNVSQATFNNVVPYAYGKAVLKGQTLVNLAKVRSKQASNAVGEINIPIKPNTKYIAFSDVTYDDASNLAMFMPSSVYVEEDESTLSGDDLYTATVDGGKGQEIRWKQTGAKYVTFTSGINHYYLHIRTGGGSSNLKYNNMQVFEYQEGMENWDIPYFEGMQSVKMPVLTTGKNLVNKENIINGVFDANKLEAQPNNNRLTFTKNNAIKVKPNTAYTLSWATGYSCGVLGLNATKTSTTINSGWKYTPNGYTFTTDANTHYVTFNISKIDNAIIQPSDKDTLNLMVEQGTVATPYEPYQSVQMAGLKATGKNLYNKSPFNGYVDSSSGKFVRESTTRKISDYIEVEPNKKYKVSGCTMTTLWGYDKDKNPINAINFYADITTTSDMRFIAFTINSEVEHSNIQVEEGTVATSYEPHQSNILTVNDDVTLRGGGEVQDTLDCLTGEVTERIGEIVLDGSEEWNVSAHSNWTTCYTQKYILPHLIKKGTSLVSDKMNSYIHYDYLGNNDVIGISITNQGYICFKYLPNGSKPQPSEVSDYLKSNPITIQYPLETESVKTVDLTCKDQDGETTLFMPIEGTTHLETLGQPIKPQMEVEIPVEAIAQNLASFIDMEGEDNE